MAAAFIVIVCLGTLGWRAYEYRHARAGSSVRNDYVIDLNTAGHAELLQLPGVGDSLAGRIEAYRDAHGPFETVLELRRVHGIGPVTLARLSPYVGAGKPAATWQTQVQGAKANASTKPERCKAENAMEDQDPSDKP